MIKYLSVVLFVMAMVSVIFVMWLNRSANEQRRRAAEDWEDRWTALTVGETYRVLCEAPSFPNSPSFKAGEAVRLRHIGYSVYDSSHVYSFETLDGAQKSFWLSADDPVEILISAFQHSVR